MIDWQKIYHNMRLTLKDEDVELFQMDLSTLKTTYLFTNKQMDRVRLNHQYITWVGEISSPNRIRMQYYLI